MSSLHSCGSKCENKINYSCVKKVYHKNISDFQNTHSKKEYLVCVFPYIESPWCYNCWYSHQYNKPRYISKCVWDKENGTTITDVEYEDMFRKSHIFD